MQAAEAVVGHIPVSVRGNGSNNLAGPSWYTLTEYEQGGRRWLQAPDGRAAYRLENTGGRMFVIDGDPPHIAVRVRSADEQAEEMKAAEASHLKTPESLQDLTVRW